MELSVKATKSFQNLLRKCFATDHALVNVFHIKAGEGVKECSTATFNTLKDLPNFTFYALYDADHVFGYFGIEKLGENSHLTGFFIEPKYRVQEVKDWFWKQVDKRVTSELFCGIYAKNTRARRFLEKSGFEVVHERHIGENKVQQLKRK